MLHTLGGLHLEGAARQQAGPLVLLAYLALEGPQERRGVQELFFPGHADPAGRLRMMLHRIRLAAPSALETPGTRLQTALPSDAAELFEVAERGEAAQVLSLYRGRFLDGVRLPGEQELEEWVFATRERLSARVRACHLDLGRAAALRGDTGLALTHAERAYLLPGAPEPGRDEARLLALLLTAAGSAFAADARTEAQGAGPLPDQAADALAMLPQGEATGRRRTDAGHASGEFTTGGPDHGQVERGPADGRKTESGDAGLPALLGREDDLARIEACFSSGARLVTLLGQGGMGKTLLARHALQRAVQQASQGRRDQTGLLPGIMVDLSAVHDEAGVLTAVASAVGARTAHLPDVAQSVRGYGLLLLDNFEQVLRAAPDIAELLESAPNLRVLVTSRERLHLSQEHVLPLEGLALQDTALHQLPHAQLASTPPLWSDAARLFVRRATRAHLGFVPGDHRAGIEQVCTLLRGVPLLIELASAWVRTLSPLDIAAQLDGGKLKGADLSEPDLDLLETHDRDVPARHASARAVLEASWQRLSAQEQAQLSRLAVFLSDFTPRAARQVCGATLNGLANLTDKSWLGAGASALGGAGRLSWHPLARAFVREASGNWPSGGWKEALPDHAHFFAQGLNASRFQAETLGDLLGEWPDIGQAARTLAALPGDWPTLTRLAREVPVWTEQVGNYASVAGLIGRVLDALPIHAAPRAQLLRARAFMHVRMHRLQEAAADYREAADLLMQSGDEKEVLAGLDALAVVHHQAGEYEQAEKIWQDLLPRLELPEWVVRRAYTLQYLAVNNWKAGRLAEAETWIREAIRVERGLVPRGNLIHAHSTLGMTLTRLGRRAEAHATLSEGLRLAHQIQAFNQVPQLLNALALNLLELNQPEDAIKLCLEALEKDQMDQPTLRADMLDTLALCYCRTGQRDLSRQVLAQSVQMTLYTQDVSDMLHRVCTYTIVSKASLSPPDHSGILHWLLKHEYCNASLKSIALNELENDVQPARKLPLLDEEVISLEAQHFCGYYVGKLLLTSPLST